MSKHPFIHLRPLRVGEICALTEGEIHQDSGNLLGFSVAPAESAEAGDICFIAKKKFADAVANTEGIICLTTKALSKHLPSEPTVIIVADAKMAMGLVMKAMLADKGEHGIHPDAVIDPSAKIGKEVTIAAGVVIGANCVIGDRCSIHANTSIQYAIIGEDCIIGANVSIGEIGFGIGKDKDKNFVLPHIGCVRIGKGCYIGANSAIDRGFIDDTVIGDWVMIDAMVRIAHNVKIGDRTIICAQSGVAGSSKLGSDNLLAAQVGVSDNVSVGNNNLFAGRAGIISDVGDGLALGGMPAVPLSDYRRGLVVLRDLGKKGKKDGR